MSGIASVDRVSASDPRAATAFQRSMQAAVMKIMNLPYTFFIKVDVNFYSIGVVITNLHL